MLFISACKNLNLVTMLSKNNKLIWYCRLIWYCLFNVIYINGSSQTQTIQINSELNTSIEYTKFASNGKGSYVFLEKVLSHSLFCQTITEVNGKWK